LADSGPVKRRTSADGIKPSRRTHSNLRSAHRTVARHFCGSHLDRIQRKDAPRYVRYDYTAWGEPIRTNGFAADGRWFGAVPETIVAVDGDNASRLIPKIQHVIENYKFRSFGDYSAWPGPNSNTFVQAVLDAVPELKAVLPPTAIGKDYPYEGEWLGITPSRTGIYVSLGGYLGLIVGWVEGIELNFFGAVLGIDIRRPAIKFPGIGRMGLPVA
jgi:hypothetical protein